MKCKQQRKKQKERSKLIQAFFSKLIELNPERNFSMAEKEVYPGVTTIYVDTEELWKLNFPENWEIILGKDREEIQMWEFVQLKRGECLIEILYFA